MPFLFLLVLTAVCLPVARPEPVLWVGTDLNSARLGSSLLTWAGAAAVVAAAGLFTLYIHQRAFHSPLPREVLARRYLRGRQLHLLTQFAVFGLSLYVLGWGWTVQSFCAMGPPDEDGLVPLCPGSELLILAPFFTGLFLTWVCFYGAEKALHDAAPLNEATGTPFRSLRNYLGFHLRLNFALIFAPFILLVIQQGVYRMFPALLEDPRFQWLAIGTLAAIFVAMPWLYRVLLGLKPLPAGPLRDRLMGAARRLHFRFSNVLVWNTNDTIVNAMVVGIVPFARYVVLTDRLITDLTPEEIEAVFGHEVGHVKHRHMPFYLGFMVVSITLVVALWHSLNADFWMSWVSTRTDLLALPPVGFLGTYIFVVFGFLSRRCERQADVYGCRAVSCGQPDCTAHAPDVALVPGGNGLCPTGIRTFISALEKVASLNGISRDKPGWLQSWMHSTIGRRVAFLQRVLQDPGVEPRFQRTVAVVKWSLLAAMLAVLVGLILL